jgi:hypothetical protein
MSLPPVVGFALFVAAGSLLAAGGSVLVAGCSLPAGGVSALSHPQIAAPPSNSAHAITDLFVMASSPFLECWCLCSLDAFFAIHLPAQPVPALRLLRLGAAKAGLGKPTSGSCRGMVAARGCSTYACSRPLSRRSRSARAVLPGETTDFALSTHRAGITGSTM